MRFRGARYTPRCGRRARMRAMLGFALVLAAGVAHAGESVRVMNPFPAAGPAELAGNIAINKVLRTLQRYGQPSLTDQLASRASIAIASALDERVTVERRWRGRGMLAHREVVHAAADGRTLLFSDTASVTTYPQRAGPVGFEPRMDLAAVAMLAKMPSVLAVSGRGPRAGVSEIISLAKQRVRRSDFGSAGDFTGSHFAVERFRRAAGIELVHVAYNGGNGAVNALAANQIEQAFLPLPAALPYAHSGALRLLAVASPERFPSLPHLPTLSESGVPGVESVAWYGIFAPAGTPSAIVGRLNRELVAGFAAERALLLSHGLEPAALTPAEFTAALERERAELETLISALIARDRAG